MLSWCIVLILFFALDGKLCASNPEAQETTAKCLSIWNYAIDRRGTREEVSKQMWQKFSGVMDPESINTGGKFQKSKSVLLVHVGKTCGQSLAKTLEKLKIKYYQLHVYPMDSIMLKQFDIILISIRDPVQRYISAFNFENPSNPHGWYHIAKRAPSATVKSFFKCFDSVDTYALSLTNDSDCGEIARGGLGHISMNTCSYLGGMRDELLAKKGKVDNVFLIEAETCADDANKIFHHLGWADVDETVPLPSINNYRKSASLTYLSTEGERKLRDYLELIGEYDMYRWLKSTF